MPKMYGNRGSICKIFIYLYNFSDNLRSKWLFFRKKARVHNHYSIFPFIFKWSLNISFDIAAM